MSCSGAFVNPAQLDNPDLDQQPQELSSEIGYQSQMISGMQQKAYQKFQQKSNRETNGKSYDQPTGPVPSSANSAGKLKELTKMKERVK